MVKFGPQTTEIVSAAVAPKTPKTPKNPPAPVSKKRAMQEVEALAKVYTHEAIDTIVSIMRDEESGAAVRLRAAEGLLDRGWGKSKAVFRSEGSLGKLSDSELDDEINRRVATLTGITVIEGEVDGD